MHALSFLSAAATVALLSTRSGVVVNGLPTVVDSPQLVIDNVAQSALNWGAGAISNVGTQDVGVHTMTRWDWVDCGEYLCKYTLGD